jgi:hypothetical protein
MILIFALAHAFYQLWSFLGGLSSCYYGIRPLRGGIWKLVSWLPIPWLGLLGRNATHWKFRPMLSKLELAEG